MLRILLALLRNILCSLLLIGLLLVGGGNRSLGAPSVGGPIVDTGSVSIIVSDRVVAGLLTRRRRRSVRVLLVSSMLPSSGILGFARCPLSGKNLSNVRLPLLILSNRLFGVRGLLPKCLRQHLTSATMLVRRLSRR